MEMIYYLIPFLALITLSTFLFMRLYPYKYLLWTKGEIPNLTMDQLWCHWMNQDSKLDDKIQWLVRMIQEKVDEQGIKLIYDELLDVETTSNKSFIPLLSIRKELMRLTDRFFSLKTFLKLEDVEREKFFPAYIQLVNESPDGMATLARTLIVVEFQLNILRWYSYFKYNDGVKHGEDDWLTYYTDMAKINADCITDIAVSKDEGLGSDKWMSAVVGSTYLKMKDKLQQMCLLAKPRTNIRQQIDDWVKSHQ